MAATEEIFDAENPTLGRQDDELVPAETPKEDDGNMPEPSSPMGLMLLRPVDQRFNSGFAHEEARDIIEIAANRRTSVESNKSSRKMEGSDNTQSMRSLQTRKDPKAFWARLEWGLMHFLSGSRIKPLVEAVEDQDRDEMMKRAQTVHTFILWALMVIAMVCAIVFFVIFDRFTTMIVIGVMSASCLFSLATLMISLRIKGADPTLAINMFIWSFIMTALLGPVACHIALGGGESGADILIFSLLAPVSCLFLVHWRPLLMTFVVTLVRQILVLIVIIAGSQLKDVFPVPPSKFPDWEEVGILIFVHIVVPLLITIAFRHAMGDFQMWHEDGLEQSDRYEQSRNDHQRLIECLIPKQMMEEHCVGEEGSPKESFPLETPDKWWDMKPVWHKNCSTIQMDIKGFTDLSSQISAEELVILVNAVFSMIDEAALCVGSAWKVETIGDCFKCMVGGIEPCQDHAQRATALAMAIIEIVKSIASRLDVNLTCRCGVNSGDVMGAMMGTLLPRYLMYGPTCDLMNVLESQGKPGHVQCSLETASRLGPEWIMTEHSVTLHNQEIHTHLLACNEENREAMFKGHGGEGLRVFLDNLAGKIPTGGVGGGAVFGPLSGSGGTPASTMDSAGSPATRRGVSGRAAGNPWSSAGVRAASGGGAARVESFVSIKNYLAAWSFRAPNAPIPVSELNSGGLASSGGVKTDSAMGTPTPPPATSKATPRAIWGTPRTMWGPNSKVSSNETAEAGPGTPVYSSIRASGSVVRPMWGNGSMLMTARSRGAEEVPCSPISRRISDALTDSVLSTPTGINSTQQQHKRIASLHQQKAAALRATDSQLNVLAGFGAGMVHAHDSRATEAAHARASSTRSAGAVLGRTMSFRRNARVLQEPSRQNSAGSVSEMSYVAQDYDDVFRDILRFFLFTYLAAAVAHVCILAAAAAGLGDEDGQAQYVWRCTIAPAVYAALAFIALLLPKQTFKSVIGKAVALCLLLCSPSAFTGSWHPLHLHTSVPWAFASVLLLAADRKVGTSRVPLTAMFLAYCAMNIAAHPIITWVVREDQPNPYDGWWVTALHAVNHVGSTTVFMFPMWSTARHLWREFDHSERLLLQTSKQAALLNNLLKALVPASIAARLEDGEINIADSYAMATVMFIYIVEFDDVMAQYGPAITAKWVNEVYQQLDQCVLSWAAAGVSKVETFNNFFMAVSCENFNAGMIAGETRLNVHQHAEESVACAARMVNTVIQMVKRPDGKPTRVKVGLNSGPLCAGVIGVNSPRFSIFGDTVNVASRMASTSEESHDGIVSLHLSPATATCLTEEKVVQIGQRVGINLELSRRGNGMEIKGKGRMQTFLVKRMTQKGLHPPDPSLHRAVSEGEVLQDRRAPA